MVLARGALFLAMLFIFATGSARGESEVAAAKKVRLTLAPLAAPQSVLSHDEKSFRFLNGCALHVSTLLPFRGESAVQRLSLGGEELTLRMVGSSTFGADLGGTTRQLQKNRGVPSYQPITLMLAGKRPYMLTFFYGNIVKQPGKDIYGFLYGRGGAVQQFTLDGQSFGIYDSDTDGFYRISADGIGDAAGAYSVFAPLGKLLSTRSGVYEITKLAEDGTELEYAPATEKPGMLAITFAAANGTEAKLAFWSAQHQLGLVIPARMAGASAMKALPGRYELRYGLAYSRDLQKLVARVEQGRMSPVEITAENQQPIRLGGPFTLEFTYRIVSGKLDIGPKDAHLFGKNGEEYIDLTWRTEPQISLLAGGRTIPLGKMKFG